MNPSMLLLCIYYISLIFLRLDHDDDYYQYIRIIQKEEDIVIIVIIISIRC